MDLLRFPAFRGCHVILVHTGYPYHREAAYMANVLPRVHVEVSEGIPFASTAAWDIFDGVLAMAPLNKICYGSDGYKVPEIIYSSAKLGKQALADVLDLQVQRRMMTAVDAQSAAAAILAGNASELYRIG
jgi:predicted TIM-barrel fold metal-dependent hydrolase